MKSPKFLDPVRLEVLRASAAITEYHDVEVVVTFRYDAWEPGPAQDALMEQANALSCVREALQRGGVGNE